MPAEGIAFSPRQDMLTYEEMVRVVDVLSRMGVSKVRVTGGEPFVRKGMIGFLRQLTEKTSIETLTLTTNGTYLLTHIPTLKLLGIHSVNLSLDSLDPAKFFQITRRDVFDTVWDSYESLLAHKITTKVNVVVMEEHNLEDIIPFCELTKYDPVTVRFIEEMPFNGRSKEHKKIHWNVERIEAHIREQYPDLKRRSGAPSDTALRFHISGYQGEIGIIPAYTRTICGTCDRIRMTPKGDLKTCLYGHSRFSIRDMLRSGVTDQELGSAFRKAFNSRAANGFEAEAQSQALEKGFASMATIGG